MYMYVSMLEHCYTVEVATFGCMVCFVPVGVGIATEEVEGSSCRNGSIRTLANRQTDKPAPISLHPARSHWPQSQTKVTQTNLSSIHFDPVLLCTSRQLCGWVWFHLTQRGQARIAH